eukprot:3688593-Rhodomonas_salina.1
MTEALSKAASFARHNQQGQKSSTDSTEPLHKGLAARCTPPVSALRSQNQCEWDAKRSISMRLWSTSVPGAAPPHNRIDGQSAEGSRIRIGQSRLTQCDISEALVQWL